ncbi:MAG: hypothetical protein KA419_19225 [Acidobacteria bacterium]|nr:hypothetical protein [Acidobacteriota bacterium]
MSASIVITGIGAFTALGGTAAETRERFAAGESGIRPIRRFDAAAFPCGWAAEAADPDAEALGVPPRDARVTGPAGLRCLAAAREALGMAGLGFPLPEPETAGFFAAMGAPDPLPEDLAGAARQVLPADPGAGPGRAMTSPDWPAFYAGAYREIHPLWPLGMLNNVVLSVVPSLLGVRGENALFAPAADAGVWAVAEAADALREGRCTVALAGGVNVPLSPLGLARAHIQAGIPERSIPGPEDEVVPGEGAAVLVLEAMESVNKRDARPLGIVSGWGFAAGADPRRTARAAAKAALAAAGLTPGAVGRMVVVGGLNRHQDAMLARGAAKAAGRAGEGSDALFPARALGNLEAASVPVAVALALEGSRVPAELASPAPGEGGSAPGPSPAANRLAPGPVLIVAGSPEGPCAALVLTPC